jgi:YggT family protein
MRDALTFILRTLVDLYIITFALRLIMQWVRADTRNPLTQFILTVTNPLVIPLRRFMPPIGRLDTATLTIIIMLQLGLIAVLINFACVGSPDFAQIVMLTAVRLVNLFLRIYLFVILIYVILSWISPGTYNPAANLLASIAEPVLAPLRRIIPSIGGLDLSPLFALILIQALTLLIPAGSVLSGLVCTSVGRPI